MVRPSKGASAVPCGGRPEMVRISWTGMPRARVIIRSACCVCSRAISGWSVDATGSSCRPNGSQLKHRSPKSRSANQPAPLRIAATAIGKSWLRSSRCALSVNRVAKSSICMPTAVPSEENYGVIYGDYQLGNGQRHGESGGPADYYTPKNVRAGRTFCVEKWRSILRWWRQ